MNDPTADPHTRPPARRAALAFAFAAGALLAAPPALRAQALPAPGDGFAWERVGDVPIDVSDLAFGRDGTLWATASDGPRRLDLSGGFPGRWVWLYDSGMFNGQLLPLGGDGQGRDTLLVAYGRTERSLDGGLTWEIVHDDGDDALYEIPSGHPYAGRLVVGENHEAAFSDDRGATWTPAALALLGDQRGGASALLALPSGRLLAAGLFGVSLSDDGGATFRPSGLWAWGYAGEALALVERPAGGDHPSALLGGWMTSQPHARAWASEDDGQTWEPGTAGVPLPEGPPAASVIVEELLPLGGASALAVLGRGTVYRTDDAGQTWQAVGRAPDVGESVRVSAAALGLDGRLYVGLNEAGPAHGWVWRTGQVTASEPGVPESSGEAPLRVTVAPNPFRGEATVTFTLRAAAATNVAVYDVLGRRVAVLASGRFEAGRHEVALDGGAWPAGVYVVRAEAGAGVGTVAVSTRLTRLAP